MKFLKQNIIDKLAQQYGLEPIIIVNIAFRSTILFDQIGSTVTNDQVDAVINAAKAQGNFAIYADKNIFDDTGNLIIPGKILSVSEIETAVNFESNSSSSQVTVTIDDTDGSILDILQTAPIHLRPAYIYVTFANQPLSSMILVFEGVIVSEFIWSEKDLSITFNFLSRVEEKEVGFSPEQGYIQDLPLEMIGRPWPFGFGDIVKYPAIRINYTPTAVTTDPIGLHDYSLDVEKQRLEAVKAAAVGVATAYFEAALQAYFSDLPDIGDQLTEQGNEVLKIVQQIEQDKIPLLQILEEQILWQHGLNILGGSSGLLHCITDIPIKVSGFFEFGDLIIQGRLNPQSGRVGILKIDKIIHPLPGTTTWGNDFFPPQKEPFIFVNAGTAVKFLGPYPLRYLVNTIGGEVTGVYAYRTFEGTKRLAPVPKKYFKVIGVQTVPNGVRTTVPTFRALVVELKQPLSTLRNQFWEDELYVSYRSSVGPNLKDILVFLISHYTNYRIDKYSLNNQIPNTNCSFVLPEQKDVMAVIKEICFQNTLAVWLSEGVFYFLFLPAQVGARTIIGLDNIIQDSVSISISPTENIITKMRGAWRYNYEFDIRNYVAIRYNDDIYGVHSLDLDYYCFNNPLSVMSSLQFWIYRKGNVWKRLKLSLPLSYIVVDLFDNVLLKQEVVDKYKLGSIKGGYLFASVVGMKINSNDWTIDLELELPIYVGSKKFSPAYWMLLGPGALWEIDELYQLTETPRQTAFYQRGFTISKAISGAKLQSDYFKALETLTPNNGLPSPNSINGDPTPSGVQGDSLTDVGTRNFGYSAPRIDFPQQQEQFSIADKPSWDYKYGQYPFPTFSNEDGKAFPGVVQEPDSGKDYKCIVYPQGIDGPQRKVLASVLQISTDKAAEKIPKGTWAIFVRNVVKETGNESYSFQIPVWLG